MMKKLLLILLCLPMIGFCQLLTTNYNIIYTSPKSNSKLHNPATQVLLKNMTPLNIDNIQNNISFKIIGNSSKEYSYSIRLSADSRTIILDPKNDFESGEKITVLMINMIKSRTIITFSFSISEQNILLESAPVLKTLPSLSKDKSTNKTSCNQFAITTNNNPFAGNLFFNTDTIPNQSPWRPVNIVDTSGSLIFSEIWQHKGNDWKVNKNNHLTYFDQASKGWFIMDQYHNELDSVYCQNGYLANAHDFLALNNGNYFLIAYDKQPYAMDTIVSGGDPNAIIEGVIIQEIDQNHNLIFQWRSWDYFHITDNVYLDLTSPVLKFIHTNAIDLDFDDHILISSRHLDEVTKIHRITGEIIWRWGGAKNQITNLDSNDYPFTYQHSIRALGNNKYILFDNGNHSAQYTGEGNISRAIEYQIDTSSMIVEKKWEFIHPDSLYGMSKGNVQRLPNGSTLINWGKNPIANKGAIITEVDTNNNITFELEIDFGRTIYRAHKHDWFFHTPILGCTDTTACNYDSLATLDNGYCGYNTSSYDTLSVAASIVWNGMPLNVSGDYSAIIINSAGCDSVVNLNLTVTTTGISDIANNKSKLVKITDMLGQETPYRRNTPLFYIYDDGTLEKKIVIE